MHANAISAPIRTAVLGSRFSSAALGPFAHSTRPTTIYQKCQNITVKHQRRAASTVSTQINAVPSRKCLQPAALTTCRPQAKILLSPILRNTSFRANSTAAAARSGDVKLDWNTFFKLRTSRRRFTLASSIITSVIGTAVGVQVISTRDLESLGAQVMGFDPFIVLGMATIACGAVGWLVGPFLGNGVWSLINRRARASFLSKEKEFYDRIKRFRVDPSSQSIANPVPDYYGEKIGSVKGYRQWLKDQRAYNRKKSRGIF